MNGQGAVTQCHRAARRTRVLRPSPGRETTGREGLRARGARLLSSRPLRGLPKLRARARHRGIATSGRLSDNVTCIR
jgi:hypothetical protein